jgi:peptide/nickel transport system substrate-binding protein
MDVIDYRSQAVILEKIPSIADGDAIIEPVQVQPGDLIVDAGGRLTTLEQEVSYLPAGCRESSCAVSYTGSEPVSMDQLSVQFSLRPGISWSDGEPLTAQDSLYSFEVAQELFPQVRADLIQHTASYRAQDEQRLEWRGVPGYLDPSYQTNFFQPLPQHAWSSLPAETLATAELSARSPIGWGAYVIEEWIAGDHITLKQNEFYFRSSEGLPNFDHLVFRFVTDNGEALAALQAGECDLINEAPADYFEQDDLRQVLDAGNAAAFYKTDTAWEQLTFSTQPSDPAVPVIFGLKEVRQAAAQCINRQQIVDLLFTRQSQVMDSYTPAAHPLPGHSQVAGPPG